MLIPIMVLWGLVVVAVVGLIWLENGLGDSLQSFYLLPWSFFTGAIVLSPSVYLLYKKKFDPFHPLVYAAWTYIFPAFVLGGVIISFGWVNPYFLLFIDNPEYNLPLTTVYVGIGFLGLIAGYSLPVGKFLAEKLEPRLPKWQWKPENVWVPGILLMLAGIGINILGFLQGIMGFQRAAEVNIFDGLLFFLLVLLSEGNILLWLGIFSTKKKTGIYYIVLIFLILFLPLRMALLGSRSSLLISIFPIAMAFQYSGRRMKWQYGVLFGFMLVVAVCIGVVYGTTFRSIKGSEARVNTGDYIGQIGETLNYISTEDPLIIVGNSAQSLADRVENLSSLGVVVANYEELAPYEASYGLENNIMNDLYTSLIPRFVWSDKPQTSDARAYSELYFKFSENSFAITPFGDLLRNFGPIGVPLGMMILGFYMRLIYSSLIDTPNPAIWKKMAYFPLLSLISFEAFYATIFPSIVRTVFILAISMILVNLMLKRKGRV
ncbi:MAG: hypothetical protein H0U50_14350 [Pyrinomonadaceae bacterium]|nr:hypothetical protein [Pyrinomonadaceae bacterium]